MGRRLVYLATVLLLGLTAIFAVASSEGRLVSIAFAAAVVLGGWWLTRRLPVRAVSVWELRGAAAGVLAVGIGLAVFIPSTRTGWDCPPPAGVTDFVCNCPVDHHMVLRAALAFGGLLIGLTLALASRRRVPPDRGTPRHQVT